MGVKSTKYSQHSSASSVLLEIPPLRCDAITFRRTHMLVHAPGALCTVYGCVCDASAETGETFCSGCVKWVGEKATHVTFNKQQCISISMDSMGLFFYLGPHARRFRVNYV